MAYTYNSMYFVEIFNYFLKLAAENDHLKEENKFENKIEFLYCSYTTGCTMYNVQSHIQPEKRKLFEAKAKRK